jgi:hypothetical protein
MLAAHHDNTNLRAETCAKTVMASPIACVTLRRYEWQILLRSDSELLAAQAEDLPET